MYDKSGKNHLVVNQYRLVCFLINTSEVVTITLYNVRQIIKEDGIIYIYFFQDRTEPLLICETDIICLYKVKIERNRIL